MTDKMVPLKIYIQQKVESKQKILVVGSIEELGNGDSSKALTLPWAIGDKWYATVMVPVGTEVSFRLLKRSADGTEEFEGETMRKVKGTAHNGINAKCTWAGATDVEHYQLTVPLKLMIKLKVDKGEKMLALGNIEALGGGDQEKALNITWGLFDNWSTTVQVPCGTEVKWRMFQKAADGVIEFESDEKSMRTMTATLHDHGYAATMEWGKVTETKIEDHKLTATEQALLYMGNTMSELYDDAKKKIEAELPALIDSVKGLTGPGQPAAE